ncbi:MAG: GAF domain-containing sensor histidine kinase [Chloroflexota bacterium]
MAITLTHQPDLRLRALYHLAVELSALRSLESVLDTALKHCLDLTESQFGFIGLNGADGRAMDVVAMQGFHPSAAFYEHNHLIPLRPNLFARAVLENRPVRSMDATADPQRVGQPMGHPPVHAFLGVPLRIRNKPIGMIGVANRQEPYLDEHEQLLSTYAAQVAIVIRNAQLYEQLTQANEALEQKVANRTQQLEEAKEALAQKAGQLQQLLMETVDVQEQERQRIAQDMHDGTNQLLIGAMLELKSAQKRLANGRLSQTEASLDKVGVILHRVEAEIERVIHHLRPPTLDALGLAPAVRRYAEQFEQYSGIPCTVNLFGEARRLSPKIEISVFRLMQEALRNVSAHAGATLATVVLAFTPKTLKLSVLDNGCGFDLHFAKQNQPGHLGLLGMRERAESLGGHLVIHTKPEEGTLVELVIPV